MNIDACPIGIVPFGTGNDFARVLGKSRYRFLNTRRNLLKNANHNY